MTLIQPAKEQTAQQILEAVTYVESASGVVMDTNGQKYTANFDTSYETYGYEDNSNWATFERTFTEKVAYVDPTWNVSGETFNFLYLKDNLRLTFGFRNYDGTNNFKLWYAVVNADTFEVINGKFLIDKGTVATGTSTTTMNEYCMNNKHLFIRVNKDAKHQLAVINLDTFEFIRYARLFDAFYTGHQSIRVNNAGVVCLSLSTSNSPGVVFGKLPMDSNGVPTDSSVITAYTWVKSGDFNMAGLFNDDEFFYVATTPSGTQCRQIKLKFNTATNSVEEIASFIQTSAPNPMPPTAIHFIKTLNNGHRVLVRFHGTVNTNGSAQSVIDLTTFTNVQMGVFHDFNVAPLFDGEKVYFGSTSASRQLNLGFAWYLAVTELFVNPLASNGSLASKTYYVEGNTPNAGGTAAGVVATVNASGIANKDGIFITARSKKLQGLKRVYNMFNYSKED